MGAFALKQNHLQYTNLFISNFANISRRFNLPDVLIKYRISQKKTIMKKVNYLILCLLSLAFVACDSDPEPEPKSHASFTFKAKASHDLLTYSNPIAIYTNHYGVKETIALTKEYWQIDNPNGGSSLIYCCIINKEYDFLPAQNELEIQFIPNGKYPDDLKSTILNSDLTCSASALTKDGSIISYIEQSTNIKIDINIGGTENNGYSKEQFENEIKENSRVVKIGINDNGEIIK